MKEVPNPISKNSFERWFINNRFNKINTKSGKHIFKFNTSEDAVTFVSSTGALAGFDAMVNIKNNKIKDKMIYLFNSKNIKTITHRYVWGVFENAK